MKKLFIYLSVASFLLCACSKKETVEEFLANKKMIYGKAVETTCLIGRPAELVYANPFLLFLDRYEGQTVTVLHTEDQNFSRRVLREGQGPGEVVSPLKLQVSGNGTVGAFQMQNGRLYEYDTESIMQTGEKGILRKYTFEDRPGNIKKVANGFVGIGPFEGGRYRLYDETGAMTGSTGEYPFRGESMNAQERFFLYQGTLCASPDGKHFAMGSSYCDNLEFFRVGEGGASLVRRYGTYDVKGHFDQRITFEDACVMSYKGAYATGKYCYLLYSGETFGEHHTPTTGGTFVFAFDWKGTHVKTFETDRIIYSFCVDDTGSALYAITRDEEEGFGITHFSL